MVELHPWQEPSAAALEAALARYGVGADASSTGTGKTIKALIVAKRRNLRAYVVCPKSVMPDWQQWGERLGVEVSVINYERLRLGKNPQWGRWLVKGKNWEWTIPNDAVLIFDEAHRLSGMATQTSKLAIAAKQQRVPVMLLSATLLTSPLKAYAIGYLLHLHNLHTFWQWAKRHGVREGPFGMDWLPRARAGLSVAQAKEEIMEQIRVGIGDRMTRIRKEDVPGFPQNQVIPTSVTAELPEYLTDAEVQYTVEARQAAELAKLPSAVELANELLDAGNSVVIFVNFLASLAALREAFPKAGLIQGGQTSTARQTAINSFQHNENPVLLVMAQAGGTGLSLHDLHGRPRASIILPGYSAVEFLQCLGRIHRAGSLSPAVNYVLYATDIAVERRMKTRLERNLNNLSALNDTDFNPQLTAPVPDTERAQDPDQRAADMGHAPHDDERVRRLGAHDTGGDTHSGVPDGAHGRGAPGNGEAGGPSMSTVVEVTTPAAAPAAHAERKHARSSPSKLKSLEICPSYESDEERPVHVVTLRGTAMHESMERNDDAALDGDEQALVNMCREVLAEDEAWAQQKVDEVKLETHEPDCYGYVDRVYIGDEGREARIRDYKFGWNAVLEPQDNPQAIAYTVGAFLAMPDLQRVNFRFLLPRLDLILDHTFTRDDLPWMKLRISTIVERRRKLAGKVFNPEDQNCLYCGNKADCEALAARSLAIHNSIQPHERVELPSILPVDQIVTPENMAKALNVASVIEDWVSQIRKRAFDMRMETGIEIPGYELIERRAKREIVDTNGAFAVLQQYGVTLEEFLAGTKVSITKVMEAVRSHCPPGTTKTSREEAATDALIDANVLTRGASFHVLQRIKRKASTTLTQ